MKQITPKIRKPTKHEELAARIERDHAHLNSAVIASKQRVLQFESEEVDNSIFMLQATIERLKERRRIIAATLTGLGAAVARRG